MDSFDYDFDFDFEFSIDPENEETNSFPRSFIEVSEQFDQNTDEILYRPGFNLSPSPDRIDLDHLDGFESEWRAQPQATHPVVDIDNDFTTLGDFSRTVSGDALDLTSGLTQNESKPSSEEKRSSLTQKTRLRDVLKAWVAENPHNLYPSNTVKESLSKRARSSVKQVSTWFANHRQRKLKFVRTRPTHTGNVSQSVSEKSSLASPPDETFQYHVGDCSSSNWTTSHHVAPPSSSQRPLSASQTEYNNTGCNPDWKTSMLALYLKKGSDFVATWLTILPEDGCYEQIEDNGENIVTSEDLQEIGDYFVGVGRQPKQVGQIGSSSTEGGFAAALTQIGDLFHKRKRSGSEWNQNTSQRVRRNSSFGSENLVRRQSNNFDGASAMSAGSHSSGMSVRSSVSRRGRRIWQVSPTSQKPYDCPICHQGFARKADMRRHMRSICKPSSEWVCHPINYSTPTEPNPIVVQRPLCFCGSDSSICNHKVLSCWAKAEIERTFYRIDHIKRHLRDTHGLESLVETIDLNQLRPPFLDLEQKEKHLAQLRESERQLTSDQQKYLAQKQESDIQMVSAHQEYLALKCELEKRILPESLEPTEA